MLKFILFAIIGIIAILIKINEKLNCMSEAIQQFAQRVNTAFDNLGKAVDGVTDDVAFIKEELAKLQNADLSEEDKATLSGIADRADALATKVEALDAATERPPTPTP